MGDSKDNVKVAIRIRPLNEKEFQEGGKPCISMQDSQKALTIDLKAEKKCFTFDYIASETSSQEDLFLMIGKPISNSCLSGYNGTIFAYGQTGAGKTFTILGANTEFSLDSATRGLLPRCFEYIFNSISEESAAGNTKFLIKCSYLEIYQEQIIDLLDSNPHNLQLREDMRHGVYVEGLIEETVTSLAETYSILKTGTLNRHVACTSMNKESSRSHSVFTLIIESKEARDGICNFRTSRFALVDLAGSERQKATDCAGERLKEAGMINKSLSALGNVINSLVDISEGKSRHVHYRDSKLTFLLKDSLGGNSKTFMVANISPSLSVLGETLSTLKFAQRAKQIKNSAVVNEDTSGAVSMLRYEVKRLKDELSSLRDSSQCIKCQNMLETPSEQSEILEVLQKSLKIKSEEEKSLQKQVQDKDSYIAGLKTIISKLENKASHDKMILKFRDATISAFQGGASDETSELLKKEVDCLREMVDNSPQAAKLFVENEKLTIEVQELKNILKNDPRNELLEINEKLVKSFEVYSRENRELTEKLAEFQTKVKSFKHKKKEMEEKSLKLQEKISELELANLTMQTENTLIHEEGNLNDFNYDEVIDSEPDLENSSKIEEILMSVNEQQLSLQTELLAKLKYENEIENLKRENSRLKSQAEESKDFKEQVWKTSHDLSELEKKLTETDLEKENLEKTLNDLKIQLEVTKSSLIQKQETLNDLSEKHLLLTFEKTSLLEKLEKSEDNYRRVVETNKTYQDSLANLEDLQEKYDKLFESFKNLESFQAKYLKWKQKCKNSENSFFCLSEDSSSQSKLLTSTTEALSTTKSQLESLHLQVETLQKSSSMLKDEAEASKSLLFELKKQLEEEKVAKVTAEETSLYYREEYLKLASEFEELKTAFEDLEVKLKLEKERNFNAQEALEACKLDFAKSKLDLESRNNEAAEEIQHLEAELVHERKKLLARKDLEVKVKQLEEEAKILKASTESFQELNLILTQKNAEITNSLSKIHSSHIPMYVADQLRSQISEMQSEMLQVKDESRKLAENLKGRAEASLKKALEDKSALVGELKAEIIKMRERFASEEAAEIKFLKSALVNKERELNELKEKGQEYYSQADEVLENMRKKCQNLQSEVNSLRDELRDHPGKDPRRNRSALRENNDSSGRFRQSEENQAMKQMNSVLTEELAKNVEIIELLKKRNLDFTKRLNESSSLIKQYQNELEKLSEGLQKITDFVFSLPVIKFNPEADSLVESTIKAISLIYESSCRRPPRHYGVLKSSNPDSCISKIVSVSPCLPDEQLSTVLEFIRVQLLSRHSSSAHKIRSLKLAKSLMFTSIDLVVHFFSRKIVSKLPKVLNLSKTSGLDGWIFLLLNFDQTFFEFVIQTLKCIENWAETFTTDQKGKASRFYEVYQELKTSDIEFPPSFLFENYENSAVQFSKRDLSRTRRLSKELRKSLAVKTKKKANVLNALSEMYQRQIELIIDVITKEGEKVGDDLIWTYSDLSEGISLYQAWKANGYVLKEGGNLSMPACSQLEDIQPKTPPENDELSDSDELHAYRDSLQVTERDERESIREDDASPEVFKMREKLLDMEELVSMYKADLSKLQTKFLDVTEKKEELKYRINAILFSNREINKLLTEANKKVEDLGSQNFSLHEDLEAFKSQNESLKVSIREIQDACIFNEKEIEKQKKYIESLETRNLELTDSNHSLKAQLERAKIGESQISKQQVPSIFMNPKHRGDSENSYKFSISESDVSLSSQSLEFDKSK